MIKKDRLKELHYSISGVLPVGEIAKKSDEILAKYGEKAKIAGFRPGHIPLNVLRQRYGDAAAEDAVNDLMNADLSAFAREKKIRLAAAPHANLDKFAPDQDAEYSLEFDILPELPSIDLEKITLSGKAKPVADADVDSAIENIRKNRSEFQKTVAGYKLAKGDLAVIDFTGYIDGAEFEGGAAKNQNLTLGSGSFIPGFEDQIIGHAAGDEFDVNVMFPKDYHAIQLAGRQARFAVRVNEARHAALPDLNDEFAKTTGMESMEKLREHVAKLLTDQNAEAAKAQKRDELLDALADKVKMSVPESLVLAEIKAADDKSGDEKKARKDAERRVKLGLILAEWGRANGVEVMREELQSAIWTEASRYQNPDEVYEFYNKNPNALSALNGMLFERKTLDAMIAKCRNAA